MILKEVVSIERSTPLKIPVALLVSQDAEQSCGQLDRIAGLFVHRPNSHLSPLCISISLEY